MTSNMTFEDRLLDRLEQVVAANPAPSPKRRGFPVPGRLAPVVAGAAAAIAAALVFAGGNGSRAYALDTQPNGSVTVHINSLRDASGLQSALRQHGIPAVVNYTPDCAPPLGGPPAKESGGHFSTEQFGIGERTVRHTTGGPHGGVASMKVTSTVRVDGSGVTFSLDPENVPDGQKVFITTSTGKADAIGIAIGTQAPAGCPAAP